MYEILWIASSSAFSWKQVKLDPVNKLLDYVEMYAL